MVPRWPTQAGLIINVTNQKRMVQISHLYLLFLYENHRPESTFYDRPITYSNAGLNPQINCNTDSEKLDSP